MFQLNQIISSLIVIQINIFVFLGWLCQIKRAHLSITLDRGDGGDGICNYNYNYTGLNYSLIDRKIIKSQIFDNDNNPKLQPQSGLRVSVCH